MAVTSMHVRLHLFRFQWAKEELEIKFACLRDALPLLPASFRPVVSHRFGLDVQQEVIDMVCAVKIILIFL